MSLQFRSSTESHVGNVRQLNEDAYYANEEKQIWCVADGMGGYDAGEIAAGMVVDAIATIETQSTLEETMVALHEAIQEVNRVITQERTLTDENQIMGCTVLALVTADKECACLWAGDTRLYLYRDDCLYQMSRDHSVVQEMVDSGMLREEEMDDHPQSHIITRAVGVEEELELDFISFDLQENDVLLLCSDGLYGELSADRIMSLLAQGHSCTDKAQALLNAVLSGQAKDNVTISVIEAHTIEAHGVNVDPS